MSKLIYVSAILAGCAITSLPASAASLTDDVISRLIRFPVRFMHRHGRFFVFYQPVCCEWSRSSDNAAPTLGLADSFGDVWPNGFVTRAASV
jgi:hypothetical protein